MQLPTTTTTGKLRTLVALGACASLAVAFAPPGLEDNPGLERAAETRGLEAAELDAEAEDDALEVESTDDSLGGGVTTQGLTWR